MRAVMISLISTVILFLILVATWLPFDTVITQLNDTVADAGYIDTDDKSSITSFYTTLRTLFTILFACSLISIPIAYVIDSHRQEHEQFYEYRRYR